MLPPLEDKVVGEAINNICPEQQQKKQFYLFFSAKEKDINKSCAWSVFIWSISNTSIRTGTILWIICSNLIVESGYFWLSPAGLLITQSEVNDQLYVWTGAMQHKHPAWVIQLASSLYTQRGVLKRVEGKVRAGRSGRMKRGRGREPYKLVCELLRWDLQHHWSNNYTASARGGYNFANLKKARGDVKWFYGLVIHII